MLQHLDLSDEEAAALIKELADITGNDRYPFSPRIQTLRGILAKLRPDPTREPAPPPKVYSPPRAKAARRRPERDFGRQRPRDPNETDSAAEGTGFELPVPWKTPGVLVRGGYVSPRLFLAKRNPQRGNEAV